MCILTCSVGPVGQGPWRLMTATELRRGDGAVAGPRRIGPPRPRNATVHVNSHPFVLTLISAEPFRATRCCFVLILAGTSYNIDRFIGRRGVLMNVSVLIDPASVDIVGCC